MAKKQKSTPVHTPAAAPSAPAAAVLSATYTVIKLTVDSIDANGGKCLVGMVISPHVEGWPEHRVNAHLRNKMASAVTVNGV